MSRCWLWCVLYILYSLVMGMVAAYAAEQVLLPTQIEMITDHQHPPIGMRKLPKAVVFNVYYLDAPNQLEESLSKDLPSDPQAALRIAQQRLQQLSHAQWQQQAEMAFAGVMRALNLGIDRYPALVFDGGDSVIYGVTDVRQALRRYQRWRQVQGKEY